MHDVMNMSDPRINCVRAGHISVSRRQLSIADESSIGGGFMNRGKRPSRIPTASSGDDGLVGSRTRGLPLAKRALYRLSYEPIRWVFREG